MGNHARTRFDPAHISLTGQAKSLLGICTKSQKQVQSMALVQALPGKACHQAFHQKVTFGSVGDFIKMT
jgi:hypothetical protein